MYIDKRVYLIFLLMCGLLVFATCMWIKNTRTVGACVIAAILDVAVLCSMLYYVLT